MNALPRLSLTMLMDEAYRFEARTGIRPSYVYLGFHQHIDILRMARIECIIPDTSSLHGRLTVNGMEVFEVNAPNHISFGIAPRTS